jgi:hypothetical protein
VEGSLEIPPVVVRSARWKSFLSLLGSVAFIALGAILITSDRNAYDPLVGVMALVFAAASTLVFAWQLVQPASLTLSPDGIAWRSLWRRKQWTWREVRGFRVVSVGRLGNTKLVGFDYVPSHQGEEGLRTLNRVFGGGAEQSVGAGWELSAAELCELLNAARTKWIGAGASRDGVIASPGASPLDSEA